MDAFSETLFRRHSDHCDIDPAEIHDLANDPDERANLAGEPTYVDQVLAFAAKVEKRWNGAFIWRDLIAKQHRRRMVF